MSESLQTSFSSRAVPALGRGSQNLAKIALVIALWVGLGLLLAIAAPKSAETLPDLASGNASKVPNAKSLPSRPI
jgi:hypothetical protein